MTIPPILFPREPLLHFEVAKHFWELKSADFCVLKVLKIKLKLMVIDSSSIHEIKPLSESFLIK